MGISNSIKRFQSDFDPVLTSYIDDADIADPKLKEAMSYSLLLGGKRVRPFLVDCVGNMLGADQSDLNTISVAIEAIHTYSLIHDDLPSMDDDELRRGKLTCHKKFDEATAVLAGDTLQSFAFNLLAKTAFKNVLPENQLKIIGLIADSATKMCAGQSIDLQNTDSKVSIEELQNMHALKTGALIQASVLAGAMAANANEETVASLTVYADALGLAFQVWDDVLDITSDTETLGKPQGSDEAANKATYPALLGLDAAKQKAQNLVDDAIQSLTAVPADSDSLEQLANYIIQRDY